MAAEKKKIAHPCLPQHTVQSSGSGFTEILQRYIQRRDRGIPKLFNKGLHVDESLEFFRGGVADSLTGFMVLLQNLKLKQSLRLEFESMRV